ncbi:hypothetical protein GCM10023145_07610 [Angustibacter luteus]
MAVALAAGVVAGAGVAPAQAAVSQSYLNAYEVRVVKAINAQRVSHHLKPLSYTSCPDRYAERLATQLRTKSTLTHQALLPIMKACSANRASENIARANLPARSLVALWMRSPGHRANILDPKVNQIGVGTQCASQCTTVTDFIRR